MALAYSIAAPCSSGNCSMLIVSGAGIFLLLYTIGKRRYPVALLLLVMMVILTGCWHIVVPVAPGSG